MKPLEPSMEPNAHEAIRTLRSAARKIRDLTHHNEILAAKVSVLDLFAAALIGEPTHGTGAEIDPAWTCDDLADRLETMGRGKASTGAQTDEATAMNAEDTANRIRRDPVIVEAERRRPVQA